MLNVVEALRDGLVITSPELNKAHRREIYYWTERSGIQDANFTVFNSAGSDKVRASLLVQYDDWEIKSLSDLLGK